jgi:DNA-binding transcriptional LysR family regulator
VNFHQLHIFYIVAVKGSFSSAAQVLKMTQPAVTMQVQTLEEHFGAKLFHRSTKKIVLSDAGRALLPYAKEAFEWFKKTEMSMSKFTHMIKGNVAIGCTSAIKEYILPRLLSSFKEESHNITVSVNVLDSDEIKEQIRNHQLRVALVEEPFELSDIEVRPVVQDEYVIIMPKQHPLASKQSIRLEDLLEHPLVLGAETSPSRKVLEAALTEAGIEPNRLHIVEVTDQLKKVKAFVEEGTGISIVAKWAVRDEEKWNLIKSRKIQSVPLTNTIYAAYSPYLILPIPTLTFLSFIQEVRLERNESKEDQ